MNRQQAIRTKNSQGNRLRADDPSSSSSTISLHPMLRLQQKIGNRAVAQALQLKMGEDKTGTAAKPVIRYFADQGVLLGTRQTQKALIQRDMSTPLPERATMQRNGSATIQMGPVRVRILLDRRTKNPKMRGRAETVFNLRWQAPGYRIGRDGLVNKILGLPSITMTIQTTYGQGVTATSGSGYGRGTTPEDIKAGQTSLGFHEGKHGTDFLDYLQNNPLPVFTGTVGMTQREYREAWREFDGAMHTYRTQMKEYSLQNTDCVGTKADFCL